MSAIANIKRHINLLPVGAPFSLRDCLKYGSRSQIDVAFTRLVKAGAIVRLAQGIYMRTGGGSTMPSLATIASVKARAFGKVVAPHGSDLAVKHKLVSAAFSETEPTYHVSGSSSSFKYRGITVTLKGTSRKNLHLKDLPVGQIILALTYLGPEGCTPEVIESAITAIGKGDVRRQLVLAKAWMPDWLAELFPTTTYPCPINAKALDAYFVGKSGSD